MNSVPARLLPVAASPRAVAELDVEVVDKRSCQRQWLREEYPAIRSFLVWTGKNLFGRDVANALDAVGRDDRSTRPAMSVRQTNPEIGASVVKMESGKIFTLQKITP